MTGPLTATDDSSEVPCLLVDEERVRQPIGGPEVQLLVPGRPRDRGDPQEPDRLRIGLVGHDHVSLGHLMVQEPRDLSGHRRIVAAPLRGGLRREDVGEPIAPVSGRPTLRVVLVKPVSHRNLQTAVGPVGPGAPDCLVAHPAPPAVCSAGLRDTGFAELTGTTSAEVHPADSVDVVHDEEWVVSSCDPVGDGSRFAAATDLRNERRHAISSKLRLPNDGNACDASQSVLCSGPVKDTASAPHISRPTDSELSADAVDRLPRAHLDNAAHGHIMPWGPDAHGDRRFRTNPLDCDTHFVAHICGVLLHTLLTDPAWIGLHIGGGGGIIIRFAGQLVKSLACHRSHERRAQSCSTQDG